MKCGAHDRPAYTLEALSVNGQIVGAATPADIERAKAETEARWGAAIRKMGLAAILDRWWYLRSDDGKPPVIAGLIESAMTNPDRPLGSVLRSFATVEPDKRAVLTDQVRAFLGRAFEGALADARLRYVDVMRSRPEFKWPHDPWAAVLPYPQNDPPAQILVDNQGQTHDGGMFDDPSDDTTWEKIKFGWSEGVHARIMNSLCAAHAELETCLGDVLALEGWDPATLPMPECLRQLRDDLLS